MRAGRLATLAVAGMLVVSGLAGCQAKPTVAAYVDDVVITEAQVDAVMDELRASLEEFSENWFAQEEQRLAAAEELTDAEREAELAALRQREDERLQRELATAATRWCSCGSSLRRPAGMRSNSRWRWRSPPRRRWRSRSVCRLTTRT